MLPRNEKEALKVAPVKSGKYVSNGTESLFWFIALVFIAVVIADIVLGVLWVIAR